MEGVEEVEEGGGEEGAATDGCRGANPSTSPLSFLSSAEAKDGEEEEEEEGGEEEEEGGREVGEEEEDTICRRMS